MRGNNLNIKIMSIMIKMSIFISILLIGITYLLNKKKYNYDKLSPIECGFEPIEERIGIDARERYYIKFYIIGITFLIFDLEAILLYPFTVTMLTNLEININNTLVFIVFLFFIYFIVLGLYYEYRKKVLYR